VVDLNETDKESDQAKEMEKRKKELGIKESLDAVVKEEEEVKIGDKTVSMARIVDQIKAKKSGVVPVAPKEEPRIVEEDLGGGKRPKKEKPVAPAATSTGPTTTAPPVTTATRKIEPGAKVSEQQEQEKDSPPAEKEQIKRMTVAEIEEGLAKEPAKYGIHLVHPGENLWTVHLNFLREYFAKKGITISRGADRPGQSGQSSGVARILKYAERMVFIYSIKDGKLSDDLDLIRPNEKIVIFNISRLDNILKNFDEEKIKRVRLDGDHLTLE